MDLKPEHMPLEFLTAEVVPNGEEIIHHDIVDLGQFHQPVRFQWSYFFWTIIWFLPLVISHYYLSSQDWIQSIEFAAIVICVIYFLKWRDNQKLWRAENFRNIIITEKRIILINRNLNFDGTLNVRYVDPSGFTDIVDHFDAGHWWAAAITRDKNKPTLIALNQTEHIKTLLRQQFLTGTASA